MSAEIAIPALIKKYIAASNKKDQQEVVSLFAPDAVVKDEGNEYKGILAVAKWQKKVQESYDFRMEPLGIKGTEKECVVTTTLSGNFPGKNPIDVEQRFVIRKDKIALLEIH